MPACVPGRLVNGNPLPDTHIIYFNIASWVFAAALSSIFLIGDMLGPYKVRCIRRAEWHSSACV